MEEHFCTPFYLFDMDFRTIVPVRNQSPKIDYNANISLFGSCFVENIGDKLQYFKFNVLQNPFGIIFHPVALLNLFRRIEENYSYSEHDIFERNDQFCCFDVHSQMNRPDRAEMILNLNDSLKSTRSFLEKSTHVVITLGTAWGYVLNSEQRLVANCHKVAQSNFTKRIYSIDEIKKSLFEISNIIWKLNPKAKIIFTVSPVRHLKDGFVENQRSKANLISAVHEYREEEKLKLNEMTAYFPSYELVMDELRDYRFYGKDMIHLSESAIDYIWEKFKEAWIDYEIYPIMKEVDSIQKSLSHRPFDENSPKHREFLEKLKLKIERLKHKMPSIEF
ncbi:GSCFA domain-containing protein [Zunongwangia sp. HRR-M8]|uniref:GSCFA domain-containing protein n=1 Tax=Zunongwangia sp. HRR-M8 TaxID=3015170 RepID=UPI0022DE9003|nr:GSCFA domain-containing protein [Zunongwangia sp. HRR-M8]WBL22933.1 GSCFA domain-containing protein [Zunongwangia sp. HRR-M8]